MRHVLLLCVAAVASIGFRPLRAADAQPGQRTPAVTIDLRLISRTPLPFQAVRLRFSAANISKEGSVRLLWPESRGFPEVKRAGEEAFRCPGAAFDREPGMFIPSLPKESIQRRTPLELNPGECVSISVASAADWRVPRTDAGIRAFFRGPGTCAFRWGNFVWLADAGEIRKAVATVAVAPAKGDDKAIADLLLQDFELGVAVMSPTRAPDLDTVEALERMVRAHPSSSYADYARFALARARLKGTDALLFAMKKHTAALTAARIRRTLADSSKTAQQLTDELASELAHGELRGREAKIVSNLIGARNGPDERLNDALAKFVALIVVSTEDRVAAARWLEQIKSRDFAYRPNVLILLAKVLSGRVPWCPEISRTRAQGPGLRLEPIGSPKTVLEATEELKRDFYDSREWVQAMEGTIDKPTEWLKFRVRQNAAGPQAPSGK